MFYDSEQAQAAPLLGHEGTCQNAPIPPIGSMDEHERQTLIERDMYQSDPATCRRIGGVWHPTPPEITESDEPRSTLSREELERIENFERVSRDYRQAMADWRSSDSCENLAAKMEIVSAAITVASGIAISVSPVVGAAGLVLGFSVYANSVVIGTWVCTD